MRYKAINYEQLDEIMLSQKINLLDIRREEDFLVAHIPGAYHADKENLMSIHDTFSKEEPLLVYCYHGISSQPIAQQLVDTGFKYVYSLTGGFTVWRSVNAKSDKKE